MKIDVHVFDRKGVELREGDIIENDYGCKLLVFWNASSRQFGAVDEAPFPYTVREADITKNFSVIGNIDSEPDFKPVYEADIFYASRPAKKVPSFLQRLFNMFP